MRLDPSVNTHPRLLRKPGLGGEPATTPPENEKVNQGRTANEAAPDKVTKGHETRGRAEADAPPRGQPRPKSGDSRFVGATHLDERQKADIGKALKRRRIGDEMGRQIFVAAVEYQLSAFADQLMRPDQPEAEAPPPARDRALEQILLAVEEQARLLSELLLQVPKPSMPDLARILSAQDERGRDYDERYLCELGGEIDRLRRACTAMTTVEAVQEKEPDPETSTDFVRKLGGIFAECFEQEPTAAEDGPFRACLEVLEETTGYVIGHDPKFLSRVIGQK